MDYDSSMKICCCISFFYLLKYVLGILYPPIHYLKKCEKTESVLTAKFQSTFRFQEESQALLKTGKQHLKNNFK